MISRQIHLLTRPQGKPKESDFVIVQVALPPLDKGQLLIKNLWMSLDPYMRGQMEERCTHSKPFKIGEALHGDAIGHVVESAHPDFPVGTVVAHFGGWREHLISDGSDLRRIVADDLPIQAHLGVLGMTGMTAHTALFLVHEIRPGETVFVSAAAGAVGSVACQLAKLHGCRVVASAGTDRKLQWLKDKYAVDSALNYRALPDFASALRAACPKGLDVYIDNVGGLQLEAALEVMNPRGRITACGMVSFYDDDTRYTGPRNYIQIVYKALRIAGMDVWDPQHWQHYREFVTRMSGLIKAGKVQIDDTVIAGLENAPRAFINMLNGANQGKMLVKLTHAQPNNEHSLP